MIREETFYTTCLGCDNETAHAIWFTDDTGKISQCLTCGHKVFLTKPTRAISPTAKDEIEKILEHLRNNTVVVVNLNTLEIVETMKQLGDADETI